MNQPLAVFTTMTFMLAAASQVPAQTCLPECKAEIRQLIRSAIQNSGELPPEAPNQTDQALTVLATKLNDLTARIDSIAGRLEQIDRLEQAITDIHTTVGSLADLKAPVGEIDRRTERIAVLTASLDSKLTKTESTANEIARSIEVAPDHDGSQRLLGDFAQVADLESRTRETKIQDALTDLERQLKTSRKTLDGVSDGTNALLKNLQTIQIGISSIRCSPALETSNKQSMFEEVTGTVRESGLDLRVVLKLVDPSQSPTLVAQVVDTSLRIVTDSRGAGAPEWTLQPALPPPDGEGRIVLLWQIPREEFNKRNISIANASLRLQLSTPENATPLRTTFTPHLDDGQAQ